MRRLRLASVVLAAAAFGPWAHGEGGLPGSLGAVVSNAAAAEPSGDEASSHAAAGGAERGGAVFSPFAEAAPAAPPPSARMARDAESRAPGFGLTLVAGLAGIAAIGWLVLRAL